MKWQNRERSRNVDDRRNQRTSSGPVFRGGVSPKKMGGGIGSIVILVVLYLLFGGDFLSQSGIMRQPSPQNHTISSKQQDQYADFISVVLKETENVWHQQFNEAGLQYREPTLVIFTEAVNSGCGYQSSQVGPFYCPADETVYIDLNFFDELERKFDVDGDFSKAYVIAHEVGHHVQNLLGVTNKVNDLRSRISQTEFNKYSVALELQADYLAGVWAHHVENYGLLDSDDLDEALNAASAIGDDTLQKQAQGYAVPETFTHGTSKQRKYWLYRGFEYGDLNHGDTFSETLDK